MRPDLLTTHDYGEMFPPPDPATVKIKNATPWQGGILVLEDEYHQVSFSHERALLLWWRLHQIDVRLPETGPDQGAM